VVIVYRLVSRSSSVAVIPVAAQSFGVVPKLWPGAFFLQSICATDVPRCSAPVGRLDEAEIALVRGCCMLPVPNQNPIQPRPVLGEG
jgi:hypothetical protein